MRCLVDIALILIALTSLPFSARAAICLPSKVIISSENFLNGGASEKRVIERVIQKMVSKEDCLYQIRGLLRSMSSYPKTRSIFEKLEWPINKTSFD